jgi:hypothetical protein
LNASQRKRRDALNADAAGPEVRVGLLGMLPEPTMSKQKLEHEIAIDASPERIWEAFTGDEFWSQLSGPVESAWKRGSAVIYFLPNGSPYASGIVLESDSPRLLSHTRPDSMARRPHRTPNGLPGE